MKAVVPLEGFRKCSDAYHTCKYRFSKTSENLSNAVELSFDMNGTVGVNGSDEILVSNKGVAEGRERRVIQKANGEGS
jgi:hypothetical protein